MKHHIYWYFGNEFSSASEINMVEGEGDGGGNELLGPASHYYLWTLAVLQSSCLTSLKSMSRSHQHVPKAILLMVYCLFLWSCCLWVLFSISPQALACVRELVRVYCLCSCVDHWYALPLSSFVRRRCCFLSFQIRCALFRSLCLGKKKGHELFNVLVYRLSPSRLLEWPIAPLHLLDLAHLFPSSLTFNHSQYSSPTSLTILYCKHDSWCGVRSSGVYFCVYFL